MSKEYDEYLKQHGINVLKAYKVLMEVVPINDILDVSVYEMRVRLANHDASKIDYGEYSVYDRWFYQLSDEERNTNEKEKALFDEAFLSHIRRNDHHWSHWVLPYRTPKALDMPDGAILEMICDWFSFSIGNFKNASDCESRRDALNGVFDWYDSHKQDMVLSENTKMKVESILDILKEHLDEMFVFLKNECGLECKFHD